MNTQIFHSIKYDLKGHGRSNKVLLAKFFLNLSTNFDKKKLILTL